MTNDPAAIFLMVPIFYLIGKFYFDAAWWLAYGVGWLFKRLSAGGSGRVSTSGPAEFPPFEPRNP